MPGAVMREQDESIYGLVPAQQPPPHCQPLYHSMHRGAVDPRDFELGTKVVRSNATFGKPLGLNHETPDHFLKSHAKEPALPAPGKPTRARTVRKSPIPARTEVPQMGLHSDKDFVTANAVETILAKPPQRAMEFRWTQKPGFGKVPGYLQKNKERMAEEMRQVEQYKQLRQQQDTSGGHVSQVSQSERQELLYHLKAKWAVANTAYQKLPFSLDTPAKQKRKERFEQQLTEIEKDIKLLEHSDMVMVLE